MADISTSWHTYPKIFSLGHRAVHNILDGQVVVEEKVDGSQFSFGRFGGELRCRSRRQEIDVLAPDKMFKEGVEAAGDLDLINGWTYRAEYLQRPRHNTLAYGRIPEKHLALFDVNTGQEEYLTYDAKRIEADRIGLEVVSLISTDIKSLDDFKGMLGHESFLGGAKIEGVVVKNYNRFGTDGHVMMAKFVSESFKEIHSGSWKNRNPRNKDIIAKLIEQYKTPARWQKAVQHLSEKGLLENSPTDIGKLIHECSSDIKDECAGDIADTLFKWAWPNISRGVIAGLAEWYKDQLLQRAFEESAAP